VRSVGPLSFSVYHVVFDELLKETGHCVKIS